MSKVVSSVFGGGDKPDTSAQDAALAATKKKDVNAQASIDARKRAKGSRGRRQLMSGSELGIVSDQLSSTLGPGG